MEMSISIVKDRVDREPPRDHTASEAFGEVSVMGVFAPAHSLWFASYSTSRMDF